MARILIVDDDPDLRRILTDRLSAAGHAVLEASDGRSALELTARELPDVMLLDLDLPVIDGLAVLDRLHGEPLAPTIVVITAFGTVEKAVEAMRRGAAEFLPKPFRPGHVELAVTKALERTQLREENRALRASLAGDRVLLGESPAMARLLASARRAATSRSTILLAGPSGTGKEVLARAIHGWSPRAERPFVAVNCVALSEELLESELFGHEKGAFTGAFQRKAGRFELANHGTLFLDEIGEIRESLQAKLLRVLQEHEFDRVGGTRPIRVDIRVIAATNRDLEGAVRAGRFREDLYYRLNVVRLDLPLLRERPGDVPLLAEHFLRKYAAETARPVPRLSPAALDRLRSHSWPGNVRELENAIERALVLGASDEIEPEDLGLGPVLEEDDAGAFPGGEFHVAVESFKRRLIRDTLTQTGGNQTRAAERLGLQRTYLARLIRRLGLRSSP